MPKCNIGDPIESHRDGTNCLSFCFYRDSIVNINLLNAYYILFSVRVSLANNNDSDFPPNRSLKQLRIFQNVKAKVRKDRQLL